MPKPKHAYSKIVVTVILCFAMLYMAQNAVAMWVFEEYTASVASALVACLLVCVATYNWRAQASDASRYQERRLDVYDKLWRYTIDTFVSLRKENPEADLSNYPVPQDFPEYKLPENIDTSYST